MKRTTNYFWDCDGLPRVLTNENGEIISRRDFMPFGEEIAPDTTYRTAALKYGVGDSVRQKFTGYERDEETGLDFAEARYYFNNHGRFTAVDPLLASGKSANPQTFNRYVYTMNRPMILRDPTGLQAGAPEHEIQHHAQSKQTQKDPVYQLNYVETGRKDFKGEPLSGTPAFGQIVVSRLEVTKDGKLLTPDDIKKSGDDVRIKEEVTIESDTIVKDGKTIVTPAEMKKATEDRRTDEALPLFNKEGKPLLDIQGMPAASIASATNNRELKRTSVVTI